MPRVSAFRGLTYSQDRFATPLIPERIRLPEEPAMHPGRLTDVSDLVCPPYDVIGEAEGTALLGRSPHNAVRLEASVEADAYAAAAQHLATWEQDGVLLRQREPSVLYYAHGSRGAPDDLVVHGVLARILLEPWGADIRPHERTHEGPKRDRLELLRATRTQLSPILAVYFDRSERYGHVMSRAWTDEWRARDADGLLHQVAAVEADERLVNFLGRQRLVVADGHHRYETALAYRDEVRARPENRHALEGSLASDWVMAVLVNAEMEEMEILPTHRLLRGLHGSRLAALRQLAQEGNDTLTSEPVSPESLAGRVEALRDAPEPVFGLVVEGAGHLLTARRDAVEERMRAERTSTAARRLDLSVLHALVFTDVLQLDIAAAAAEGSLLYTKDAAEVVDRATRGDVQAAVLVRPTRIDQLADVARAGDVMPQKSTYFYPKLLTGMVFNPLED